MLRVAQCSALFRHAAAAIATPPPRLASEAARSDVVAYTHEGGAGGKGKENQDTYFVAHPSDDLSIYAVLDGHGKKNGRVASLAAAACLRSFLVARCVMESISAGSALKESLDWVVSEPETRRHS